MPNIGFSASRWPITNGMTYIVRPRMQPAYSPRMRSFISLRVHPVVGGPAVLLVDRADVGAVLDARDVDRVGGGVEGVRLDRRVELGERAGRDQGVGQLGPLLVGAGAPVDAVGLRHRGDLVDEVEDALVGGRVARTLVAGIACLRVSGHVWSLSRIRGVGRRSGEPAAERVDGVSWSRVCGSLGIVAGDFCVVRETSDRTARPRDPLRLSPAVEASYWIVHSGVSQVTMPLQGRASAVSAAEVRRPGEGVAASEFGLPSPVGYSRPVLGPVPRDRRL